MREHAPDQNCRLPGAVQDHRTRELWCKVAWVTLFAVSALRSLRFPHAYARTHWLFHYGHGFVKRGLPGQLLRPFVLGKTPEEVRTVIDWVSAFVFLATALSIVSFTTWCRRRCHARGPRVTIAIGTTLLAVSPFAFNLANLVGYFDHLLVLATLASVACVISHRPVLAGMVGVGAALTHEMFGLFGLPVLLYACWSSPRDRTRTTISTMVLPVAALVLVGAAERLASGSATKLQEEVLSMRLLPQRWVEWGFHSMQHSAYDNLVEQSPKFVGWLMEPVALRAIHPTTFVLWLLAVVALAMAHRSSGVGTTNTLCWSALGTVLVASPCIVAAMGWDWPRFFAMSQFHAYALVAIVSVRWEESIRSFPQEEATDATLRLRFPRWPFAGIALLGAFATVFNWSANLPRVASGDESENPFALRPNGHYTCRSLLFRNSDFSGQRLAPWQSLDRGRAFVQQPVVGDIGAERGQPARPWHEWIATFAIYGDDAVGVLESPAFTITESRIAFRLGGTPQSETYVRLTINGREVHRAVPHREGMRRVIWNVAPHLGSIGTIQIADNSHHGHLNVERFCYPR